MDAFPSARLTVGGQYSSVVLRLSVVPVQYYAFSDVEVELLDYTPKGANDAVLRFASMRWTGESTG